MNFYHKAISLAGFVLLTVLPAQAQVRQTREEYINKYKKIAVAHMERYGIPASITMAQGILESDCGNSWLSQASNNHFGIKCKRNWTGDVVYYDDDEKGECFRSYPSVEASYQDHAEFLDSQPRYDSLFSYAPNDYKSWARGLKAAGCAATHPHHRREDTLPARPRGRTYPLRSANRTPHRRLVLGPKQRRSSRSDRFGGSRSRRLPRDGQCP